MIRQGLLVGIDHEKAVYRYIKALKKGVLKVMSKMGISTLQSYRGAQIFEAVGLDQDVRRHVFHRTASRVGGVGLDEIADEVLQRHRRAFPAAPVGTADLEGAASTSGGATASIHLFNPETVFRLQHATRSGQYAIFKEYTKLVDDQNERLCTLRGLFDFRLGRARRSRSTRSSRSRRSSSGSRPAP